MDIKIILSRKGMDTSIGKLASPIFYEENKKEYKLVSLPIPVKNIDEIDCEKGNEIHNLYKENLLYEGSEITYKKIIENLSSGKKLGYDPKSTYFHYDPLIDEQIINKHKWCPAFGQSDHAGSYLTNKENINYEKDRVIFLFFGRFHFVKKDDDGNYVYMKKSDCKENDKWYLYKDIHLVWGYMVVNNVYTEKHKIKDNLSWHQHASDYYLNKSINNSINVIFTSNEAGVLPFDEERILTKKREKDVAMSIWDKNKFRNSSKDGVSSSNKKEKNGIPFDYVGDRKNSATNHEREDTLFLKGQWQELILTDNDECEAILRKLSLDELI